MDDANRVISGLWVCPEGAEGLLSDLELLCLHSFIANGHDFRLYVYDDIANIPQPLNKGKDDGKIEVCDANEILPKSKIFLARNSFAPFADWWRWELMLKKGGWYADMDVVCLNPFDFSEAIIFGRQDMLKNGIQNNILKLPAGHFLAQAMAESCKHPDRLVPWDTWKRRKKKYLRQLKFWQHPRQRANWGEAGGPDGVSLALAHFNLQQLALPPYVFSPLHYSYVDALIDDSLHKREMLKAILRHSHAVHLYNEVWRVGGWDKNGVFVKNSLIEYLKREYLPGYSPNYSLL